MRRFKVEFFDAVAAQNYHPGLLRMGRVDEHFVGHWQISWGPCPFASRRIGGGAGKRSDFVLLGGPGRWVAPQAWKGQPPAGDTRTLPSRLMQTLTCASNINSKPRRDGSAERGRDFARCRRCGATPFSGFAAAKARRA